MAKQENRRATPTRQLLQEALLLMLKEQDIRKITVSALTARAGVNRTTFYSHYASPMDVLRDIAENFLKDVDETLGASGRDAPPDVLGRITRVFWQLDARRDLARLLLNYDSTGWLADNLFKQPAATDLWRDTVDHGDAEQEAALTVALYGGYQLVKKWLNDDNPIPPDEEAALVLRLARKVCQ